MNPSYPMVEKVMHEQRSMVRRNWSQSDPSTEIRAWIDQRNTVTHPCLPTMIFDKAQPDAIIEEWVEGEDLVSFLNQSAPLDDLQVAGIILQLLDVVSHTSGAAGKDFCPTAEDVVIRQLAKGPVSITWTGWRPQLKTTEGAIDNLPTFLLECLYRAQFGCEFDTVESDLKQRFDESTSPNSLRRGFVNLLLQTSNSTSAEAIIEQFESRLSHYDIERTQRNVTLSQQEAKLSNIEDLRTNLREARIRESYLFDWLTTHEQSRAHAEKELERSHRQLAHSQSKLLYLNRRTLNAQSAEEDERSEWQGEGTMAKIASDSNDPIEQENATTQPETNPTESIEPVNASTRTTSVDSDESVTRIRRWTHPQTLFAVMLVIVGATILGIWVAWSVIIKVESTTPKMPAPRMIGAPR